MSQFVFLKAEFPEVFGYVRQAEEAAIPAPRMAALYCRLALETAVCWVYRHDRTLRGSFDRTLASRLAEPSFQALIGPTLSVKARYVRDTGNSAAHGRPVTDAQAATALRELFDIAYWLVRTYARGAKPDGQVAFSIEALPRLTTVPQATLAQLEAAAARFEESVRAREEAEAARQASEEGRAALEVELRALRAEVAAAKAANLAVPDSHDYREAETRDLFIDLLLREAGFDPEAPDATEVPVAGMPNQTGEGFVDYVLCGNDNKPLALVETKRTRKDPKVGQQQAKLYADALEAQCGQRPVIFLSNGYDHWIWDDTRYPPRPVQGFLKKDELALMIQRRKTRKALVQEAIDTKIADRPYQHRAIRRVVEAFECDHQRKALLVMATGAGKTRTVIALCDLLMRANWVKRVLFLADRTALVNQAAKAFKTHLPEGGAVNLLENRKQDGRVYISTYPTMMRLIDQAEAEGRRFGVGHFDLIVIDEAHRSVYRKYRAIFEYFDSLLVGLTATPKDEIDRDTYRLFDLQTGVPTDAYGLEEAVKDKFLVPPKAVSLTTNFLDSGIRYDQLSEDDKEKWDTLEWGEDGAVPGEVEAPAINKWLFNADTVDHVLRHLMARGLKVEDGDRLGKTIVFARNHAHAQFIADRFNVNYPHFKGKFAQVIDFQVSYAQSLIDSFSTPAKDPHIAISVDMLDTGIDVPEVVNLVFFKPVRSKTKFWQMVGRGTRLRPNLFGPERHKDFFLVFDWCRNFEFFNQEPETVEGAAAEPLAKRLFAARVALVAEIDGQAVVRGGASMAELRKALAYNLRDEIAGMSLDNFLVRPKRRQVEKFSTYKAWKRIDRDAEHELNEHVAGLPTSVTDDDLPAKQFDLMILRAQLALLRGDGAFPAQRERITNIASLLEELANIPMVTAEMALIQELQTEEFWLDVTAPMLETVRRRLRALVKLIEAKKRPPIYSDFEDRVSAEAEVEVRGLPVGTEAFKRKALLFLKPYETHVAILRLKRNEPLTATDLSELERIFTEAGVDEEALGQLRADGGLGRFVRSLVGLDREAAQRAFADFLNGRTLTANQMEFLNLVIDHLTMRGVMDPGLLYESPFTAFDSKGVEGVFETADVLRLVQVLRDVEKRAAA